MLLDCLLFLSLAILSSAVEPWEINRSPTALSQNPNGIEDGPETVKYFLDGSCVDEDNDIDLRPVIAEVIQMATEGFDRLSNNIGDFRTGYTRIMKVTPDQDLELRNQKVMRVFHRIRGMEPAATREGAHIRIYCDNDISSVMGGDLTSRWIPCPDQLHPNGPYNDGRVNSQLGFDEQIFMDQVNLMYRRVSTHGVQDPDPNGDATLAQTYRSGIEIVGGTEREGRETITLGDSAFREEATLGEVRGTDIIRTTIDRFEGLTSLTLFHELCHSHHILGVDSTGPGEINGWPDVRDQPADIVRESADAFAFLGLYALLNSRNIRLNTGSDALIPTHPFVDVTKAKRSRLHTLTLGTCPISRTRAVPFVS